MGGGQMAARLRPTADVVAPRGCSKVAVESLLVFGHACFATTKHPNQGGTPWTNTSESTFTQQVDLTTTGKIAVALAPSPTRSTFFAHGEKRDFSSRTRGLAQPDV